MKRRRVEKRWSSVGARKELLAAAYFLDEGYDVYRAVNPDASCDLLIRKSGEVLSVEVKTSSTTYLTSGIWSRVDCDVLVLVDEAGAISLLRRPALLKATA